MKKIIFSLLALVTMSSCSKEIDEVATFDDNMVRISSSITTRTVGNNWESGDAIGVYMSTNGADFADLGENILHSTASGDGVFESTTPLYFPTSDNVDLLAYYPHKTTTTDAGVYSIDVATQSPQGDIDLMISSRSNVAKSQSAIEMEFDHKLSNIVLTVVAGDGYADLAAICAISKIELSGSVTTADYGLTSDGISLGSDKETIEFVVAQSDEAITAEAIIIPQTLSGSSTIISVTTEAGAVHSVALNGTFAIGTQYTYDLKLSLTELTINGATINDWNSVSGGDLEARVLEQPVWEGEYPESVDAAEAILGSADANGVYQIGGIDKFAAIAYLINEDYSSYKDADIVLNIDLDLSDEDWTPIGNYNYPFSGTFDGGGHLVSGLSVTSSDFSGLFGCVSNDANISNIGVSGSVSGSGAVGGVVGYNNGGTLTNCYNTGVVTGNTNEIGGVAGANSGTLINCYNTGSVTGPSFVGGVVGSNNSGTLTNCYNTGIVSGDSYVGGVVGYNDSMEDATLTNCYNTGNVSGEFFVGGVVGYNNSMMGDATLTNCYNTGDVDGEMTIGGVVGYNVSMDGDATLTNCYNTGNVSGDSNVGGVVGSNYSMMGDATLTNCYNTGIVSGDSYVGGVVGSNASMEGDATLTNCYYLYSEESEVTSGVGSGDTITSMTTSEMQSADFVRTLNNNASEYNTENPDTPQACAWVAVSGDYPTLDFNAEPSSLE